MVGLLMRLFSFGFHLFLGLVMTAIGFVAWASNQHTLQLAALPWTGPALTYSLMGLGVAGVVITVLAIRRIMPSLFMVWSLAVLLAFARGYFFSSYNFALSGVSTALYFIAAALLAFIGSVLHARPRHAAARRQSVLA
jgi:hypothetical protein